MIRVEPRGCRAPVTWAEFVEAGLLREYRQRQVPMTELRAFIEILRERYGIPYPLADARPFVNERQLVVDTQDRADLEGSAATWRPAEDKRSPVLIDPERRFGKPSVRGISTDVIWEHVDGGEDETEVAEDYGLTVGDVRWALSYEAGRRAS